MRLCEIFERLGNYPINFMEKKNPETDITGIRMITKVQTVFLPNILYFGEVSALPQFPQKDYCINFLCYGNISARPDLYSAGKNLNLLFIPSEEDAFQIYNQIQDIFLESEQVVTGMRAFLDALFADMGLQGICDVAYGILGNPLFIVDNSYKYLAFSSGTVADSKLMEKETSMGQIAEEGIRQIRKMQLDDKIRRSSRPFYFFNPVHQSGMLVGSVTIHDIEVGHVMLYEMNKPFTDNDYELVHRLCRITSIELQKNDFYKKNKGTMYAYFIGDLLDNRAGNLEGSKERLATLGYTLKDELFVLTISPKNNLASQARQELIVSDLQRFVPESLYVVYDNTVVLLINGCGQGQNHRFESEELENYLKHNGLIAGISNNFQNIQEIRKYYEQALKAADLGQRILHESGLHRYETMSIFHILEICENKEYSLWDFCHPALPMLINYDKKKGTDFLNTLYQYLNFSQNTMETANYLHIHKNTLLYRIEKIRKITGNPLNHGDELIKLHFSFKILQYLNII
ncbi:MAG: helix-turn-helix domain-containing protein [Clostridiales bacterium]|nr:helix-turn-helix domain-containing protein [Clostridiales bacterium]